MIEFERVLFLGPENSPLVSWLRDQGEVVLACKDKIDVRYTIENEIGFIVSYGYRYILGKDIVERFHGRAVNLHISYLPWNRGADPNFWSIVNNTPKGVSIHHIDEGLDTGDIVVQRQVKLDLLHETLATSYDKLQYEIQEMFKENWKSIKSSTCMRKQQMGTGSYHRRSDKTELFALLPNGWDTPLHIVSGIGEHREYSC